MSIQQNQEVTRRIIEEAFNQGNFDVLEECFRPDYIENQFGLHKDLEGMRGDIRFLRSAFPDFHLKIEHLSGDGDLVWLHMTATGTNLGGLMGPPNGKTFQVSVFDLLRFEDGKVVEHWGSPDRYAQMKQLGLLPRQEAAPTG